MGLFYPARLRALRFDAAAFASVVSEGW